MKPHGPVPFRGAPGARPADDPKPGVNPENDQGKAMECGANACASSSFPVLLTSRRISQSCSVAFAKLGAKHEYITTIRSVFDRGPAVRHLLKCSVILRDVDSLSVQNASSAAVDTYLMQLPPAKMFLSCGPDAPSLQGSHAAHERAFLRQRLPRRAADISSNVDQPNYLVT